MRRKLIRWLVLGLFLLPGMARAEVTISSPLGAAGAAKLSLAAPPVVPAPGVCLGWVGATGERVSGEMALNFAPGKWQPLSVDLFTLDGVKVPAVGLNVPAAKVVGALGINLGGVWGTFLGAVGGGPWGSYAGGKFRGGLYYRAEVLAVSF